jgi:hypothetical protein
MRWQIGGRTALGLGEVITPCPITKENEAIRMAT